MPSVKNSDYVLMTMAAGKKMLLFEWICDHLDKNTFPEMRYIDETKTAFQVPWIHKSNRRWNENVAAVFKAWAKYKGKEENFSFTRAKTNFRMAMKYQPNIREVTQPRRESESNKSGKGIKRKSSDDEKCVKVYQIVQANDIMKKKVKKTHSPSASSDCCPQESSSSSTGILQSARISSPDSFDDALPFSANHLAIPNSCELSSTDQAESFEQATSFGLESIKTSDIFEELRNFLPDDGDFIRLPPCHELVERSRLGEIPKPCGDTSRYLPLQPIYESIGEPVVSSTDDSFRAECSPGHSSDELSSSGESFSLYSFANWSKEYESHCEVTSSTNYTDEAVGYRYSDVEALELMENCVGQLLMCNFG